MALAHEDELMANWERVRNLEPLVPIEPLANIDRMVEIPPLVHVTDVEVIGEHRLRRTFEDGAVGNVAFGDHEWRGVFEPLRDPARFAEVTVDQQMGTIVSPRGLDMAPEPLHEEATSHPRSPHRDAGQ